MRRIGFFGGTFDPIHFGHLNLAFHLLEKRGLDQIFFSPANYSPEKEERLPVANRKDRREMTFLGIEGLNPFSLVDIELERRGPSYTIDTIRMLSNQYPSDQFFLILGEDLLKGLEKWREVDALLKLAPPLVGTRPNVEMPKLSPSIAPFVEAGSEEILQMEISSTHLRDRLFAGLYCGHLIPAKVLDYIKAHGLYCLGNGKRSDSKNPQNRASHL